MHHRKYSNFLIISFVAILILGVYSYFQNDLESEASNSSGISSSLDTKASKSAGSVTKSKKASEDTAFLKKLASLSKIEIDTSFLDSREFKLLVDNNIELEKVPYGRTNPFAPTDKIVINDNKPAFSLTTEPPTSISSNSVVLNGKLEGVTSNNIYFEYGTTEQLGKVTPKVIPSLVGGLGANVNLLTPKTKYFYRVAANINGVVNFGEIMSFSTN